MLKILNNYAQRIQQLRERHGLTLARMANSFGVTPALVSQWESKKTQPEKL